jgi:hypothetical protein
METQQMIELLLARMDANTNANQEDLLARINAMMDTNRKVFREEMGAIFGADRKEIMSYQVMREVCLDSKELNPEDMESEVEYGRGHSEIFENNEEAAQGLAPSCRVTRRAKRTDPRRL